jgi:hypothetical protein
VRNPFIGLVLLAGLACDATVKTDPAEWSVTKRVSPVDSSVDLHLSLLSMKGPGVGSQPYFMIGCDSEHKLQVMVALHYSQQTGQGKTKYRLDQNPPVSEQWLYVSGAGAAVPTNELRFLKQIVKARRLTLNLPRVKLAYSI